MRERIRRGAALALAAWLIFGCLTNVSAAAAAVETADAPIWRVETAEKLIALTFDDGPHPHNTDAVLGVLAKYEVKATFFMIGKNVAAYPEVARRVAEAGHEIGSHTYHHPHLSRIDEATLREELDACAEVLASVTGAAPTLFRPPEGARTAAHTACIRDAGYRQILWSVDTNDWRGNAAGCIARAVLSSPRAGDIILMHDYVAHRFAGADALERIIPALLSEGYRFVTVSALLSAGTPVAPVW